MRAAAGLAGILPRVKRLVPCLLLLALVACASHRAAPAPAPALDRRVANLHAFARLYGVVRWFHPSDAAAAIDWNRFAIDGARAVVDAPNAGALRDDLVRLFAPVAPTLRIRARLRAPRRRARASSGGPGWPRCGRVGAPGLRRQRSGQRLRQQAAPSGDHPGQAQRLRVDGADRGRHPVPGDGHPAARQGPRRAGRVGRDVDASRPSWRDRVLRQHDGPPGDVDGVDRGRD